MTADTTEITTPNGQKVVVRDFTTHGDDKKANAILNEGLTITASADGEPQVQISAASTTAAEQKYVELLVLSVDGQTEGIQEQLEALRSEDYAAILTVVRGIVQDPKVGGKS